MLSSPPNHNVLGGQIMANKEEILLTQKALCEACEYLDMRCTTSTKLSMNTRQGVIDIESHNALIESVTARLSRQVIMSKRLLDRLV